MTYARTWAAPTAGIYVVDTEYNTKIHYQSTSNPKEGGATTATTYIQSGQLYVKFGTDPRPYKINYDSSDQRHRILDRDDDDIVLYRSNNVQLLSTLGLPSDSDASGTHVDNVTWTKAWWSYVAGSYYDCYDCRKLSWTDPEIQHTIFTRSLVDVIGQPTPGRRGRFHQRK